MAPPGFQIPSQVTDGKSPARFRRPGYELENDQQVVTARPRPTGEVCDVTQDQGGWWIPAEWWKWIVGLFLHTRVSHPSQQDGQPETRATHNVQIGDHNQNSGTIQNSYNTTNYSGNAKNFGQNGTVTINGDIR
ncbi:hypothetical protein HOY82DRAFT_535516 [Tuber indicum]|nr:hypothetical protein HOY82DRAFT_535516 [Tuber indicum]